MLGVLLSPANDGRGEEEEEVWWWRSSFNRLLASVAAEEEEEEEEDLLCICTSCIILYIVKPRTKLKYLHVMSVKSSSGSGP